MYVYIIYIVYILYIYYYIDYIFTYNYISLLYFKCYQMEATIIIIEEGNKTISYMYNLFIY